MNSLLGLNIVFENLLDALHNRMKFQVIWVGFLCDLSAYRLTDYATSSNVHETVWCEECMSFLPEWLNDLQEALR
jgi:hypothetical protein